GPVAPVSPAGDPLPGEAAPATGKTDQPTTPGPDASPDVPGHPDPGTARPESPVDAAAGRAIVTPAGAAAVSPTPPLRGAGDAGARPDAVAVPDGVSDAVARQVADALSALRRLSDGAQRLLVKLHPEELGSVDLDVTFRDGVLNVRAVTHNEAARAALDDGLASLRARLEDAGIASGSLEVGADTGRQAGDRPADDGPHRSSLDPTRATAGPLDDEPNPTTTPAGRHSGRVDVTL
ncbi:MAG: flagellar hook-length control protein FliK, partial [Acidimicrobiales bacterium]